MEVGNLGLLLLRRSSWQFLFLLVISIKVGKREIGSTEARTQKIVFS